jgi:hypothetical protein
MSVYLITGSSRGLGRSITEAALAAGHDVVATARRPEQLDDLAGDRLVPFALDVTDYDAATRAVREAVERFGRLDVVVNNAGYADLASVEDMSIEAFRTQIDTNLLARRSHRQRRPVRWIASNCRSACRLWKMRRMPHERPPRRAYRCLRSQPLRPERGLAVPTTIHVEIDSLLPAERVLGAAHDFSERRTEVFPAVRAEHLEIHELGDDWADVTEGTPAGLGINWERCRYDWSRSGSVVATVTDSNVYGFPGSSWEIRASPKDGGSRVEMIWVRDFQHAPRALVWGTLFRLVGKPIFNRYAKDVMQNLERLEQGST